MSEESKPKSLFGSLLEKENVYLADTIVDDLAAELPQRKVFFSTSPTQSWMSVNGFQPGTMELIYGPKSSGKTMLALDRIKNCLATDPEAVAIYVDAEMGFEFESTVRWMRSNGVDTKRVMILREVNISTIFEKKIMGEFAKVIKEEGVKVAIIVFDSIQAMAVKDIDIKKMEKQEATKQDYGARANYISRIMPFYRQFCRNNRIFSTFIGQARSGGEDMFGNAVWSTNGGEALYHEMQYRWLVTRTEGGKDQLLSEATDANGHNIVVGHKIRFVCEKNKMGEGLNREGFCDIIYMKGIVNVEEELIELCKNLELIKVAGAWFEYDGQKYQGAKQLAEHLRAYPMEYQKLYSLAMMDASNPAKYGAGKRM